MVFYMALKIRFSGFTLRAALCMLSAPPYGLGSEMFNANTVKPRP